MSPKSRGRPPGRGRAGKRRTGTPVRQLTPLDRLLREARDLPDDASRLLAEVTASRWLGRAWSTASLGERTPEADLVGSVADRALAGSPEAVLPGSPARTATTALAVLATVAAPDDQQRALEALPAAGVAPSTAWAGAVDWQPRRAWLGSDVYDSQRAVLVEFAGPDPHDLLARIGTTGGLMLDVLSVLEPGAAEHWPVKSGIPLAEVGVPDALAELASALRVTDLYWPRQADPGYSELRALAHARSRPFLPQWSEVEPVAAEVRQELVDAFAAQLQLDVDEDEVRLLADLFLDFGEGYLVAGPLAWSPGEVERFLLDWVPRKAVLDAGSRDALPQVLRAWVAFALRRRGVGEQHVGPVMDYVTELEAEYRAAFDHASGWGPGKQVMAGLVQRGVDLDDRAAVEAAVREYNAEQLAWRLRDGD